MPSRLQKPSFIFWCAWVVLAYLGWPGAAPAAIVDTVIVSDGGPGPYGLGRSFIDTGSIRLSLLDTSVRRIPPFTFIDEVNAILFSEAIDSGVRIEARFRTYRYGLPRTFFLFEKPFRGSRGDSTVVADSTKRPLSEVFAEENLTLSGYKSVGVSVNNLGSANLEQALDVTLSGSIAPQTTLSGHLTDQGSSLEGTTREVANLDMVYVSLDNPRYNALLGDQYLDWQSGGMLSGRKKIKGISAGLTLPSVSIKGSGAISSGNYTVQTITGRNGLQGPYRLVGGGEEGFIVPVQGTVRVSIGDKKYQEGADRDFSVDYEQGSITFTPRILIMDEDIIRVEYEYHLYDYQRAFIGTSLTTALSDSSLTIKGTLWHESDDKNRPLDVTIGPREAASLAAAGDSGTLTFGGRLIDPKDVAWQSQHQPLYRLDSASGHFYFWPFDPINPTDNQGYYYIAFRRVGAGKGDYAVDSSAMRARPGLGEIESFVGAGRGDRALPLMPLPQSKTLGEIELKGRLSSLASVEIDLAGVDHDRNLFSSRDDNDNRSAAANVALLVGRKRVDRRSVWLGGAYSHVTPKMSQEVASAFERNRQWDDTTATTKTGLRQSWESSAGATLLPGMFVEGGYGQYMHDRRVVTDRATSSAHVSPTSRLSLFYNSDYFRHWAGGGATATTTRRGEGRIALTVRGTECSLEYRDEWRTGVSGGNRGMGGAGANVRLLSFPLRESVFYSQFRRGTGGLFSARDTGYSLLWDQELDRQILPSWHVNGSSHYFRQENNHGSSNVSILVLAQNDVSLPSKGFATRQNYQVNIEKASSYVQVPVPVGKGLGDHVWDTLLHEYVPFKNGDYIIQEQEAYGDSSVSRVRKSKFNITWGYSGRPQHLPGILGDLEWSGILDVEEHLRLSPLLHSSSWIPGYASLFNKKGSVDSLIRYASVLYRQTMDWSPDSAPGLHGRLSFQPSLKKIRDYSESGTEWGIAVDRTLLPWFFGLEGALLSMDRHGTSAASSYRIADRHTQATEKIFLRRELGFFIKETGGWASKSSDSMVSGWYSRLSPGISWQPIDKGSAEVSYTWSSVGVPGTLDYRIAQGFSHGITHTIDFLTHINFGKHFTADLSYRAEFGGDSYAKSGLHIVSMQMKAFL